MGTVEPYETKEGRRYRVRYRRPDRKQAAKRGFKTKRAAEEYLAGVEVAKARGEWRDPSRAKITIRALSIAWLAAQVQLKPTTRSGYAYTLKAHVLPRWGEWPIASIGHGEVQGWVNELATSKAPSTVRQIHLVLSLMLKYAVRDARIVSNPCDDIQLPRSRKPKRGYLTHAQIDRLATACGPDGDVVRFLAYTGLRWGEMAALRVGKVDMSRRRIHVTESVSEIGGSLVWGSPKTHEHRSVPFPPRQLGSIIASRCADKSPDDLVFTSPNGSAMRNNNFRKRVFIPAVMELRKHDPGFPDITPHDLRHTAASLAIAAGANVKAVQRMLGHTSAAMTLDVYADLFDDDLDAVATALDQHASAPSVSKMCPQPGGKGPSLR